MHGITRSPGQDYRQEIKIRTEEDFEVSNKGQTIQDLDACGTVVQFGDLNIEGCANSEAAGV